ncbi:hypothetical protein [Burkholderia cepacia]|nr:hypothetical protein [Burkholderia cepacia]
MTENEPDNELLELLARITPDNQHSEVDFGPPAGLEAWPPDEVDI